MRFFSFDRTKTQKIVMREELEVHAEVNVLKICCLSPALAGRVQIFSETEANKFLLDELRQNFGVTFSKR